MLDFIKNYLLENGIELFSAIPLSSCKISKPHLLKDIENGTVFIFAVPYLSREICEKRNISAYACAEDYHLFFSALFDGILPKLKEKYPKNLFSAFSDHSPIDERDAAAKGGLGVIGKNNMLISEKYSSYIFLGEIITDALIDCNTKEIQDCIGCNKCIELCPALSEKSECLSALTQKKGALSEQEISKIKNSSYVWGCDACQEICPYTRKAKHDGTIYTNIEFFNKNLTPYITSASVSKMSDDDFSRRAYSWRKKETVLRNLMISECKDEKEGQG